FTGVSDPVALGLVASLARPGGNITGVTNASSLSPQSKRLELLKDLVPTISRVAFLFNPLNASNQLGLTEMRATMPVLGLQLLEVPVQTTQDIEAAIQLIASSQVDAINIGGDAVTTGARARIVEFATTRKLPTAGHTLDGVRDGILMAYAEDSTKTVPRT